MAKVTCASPPRGPRQEATLGYRTNKQTKKEKLEEFASGRYTKGEKCFRQRGNKNQVRTPNHTWIKVYQKRETVNDR